MPDSLKPRLLLRLGVTGHRPPRLANDQRDKVKACCAELFAIAQRAIEQEHGRHSASFSSELPGLTLISSLAEGADVLAAEAALASGMSLSACLPFPPAIYAADFAPDQWAVTEALLARAESTMELDHFAEGPEKAYEAAGRVVLSQSDILIAVWDGEAARGRGGTAQIVAEAVAQHVPVIHIDARGEAKPELIWSGWSGATSDGTSLEEVDKFDALTHLAKLVVALSEPPGGEDGRALRAFINPEPAKGRRSVAWPLLLAMTGAKHWRKISFRTGEAAQSREWIRPYTAPFAEHGPFGSMLNRALLDRFGHADAQANRFAMRFRSAFVSNYALSGLAVLLALSSLLFPSIKLILIMLELLVIMLILANTHAGKWLNLHQCWLDRRHLAERLRTLILTAILGRLWLREGDDAHLQPGWAAWYARATARELGLPDARLDSAYLEKVRQALIELIDEQAAYHRQNTRAMAHADHRLHRAGDVLFYGTIIACVLFIVIYLAMGSAGAVAGLGLAQLVTFVTALFPALGAALYGIRMQGDFAATSERSAQLARRLNLLKTAITRDPLTYERLVERSRGLRRILLSEVEQWRSHSESRPLALPG